MLMELLKELMGAEDFTFSATNAHIRCMPHMVHLAAIKLLESIGAITKSQKKKAESKAGAYQETTSLPVDHMYDEKAVLREDEVIDNVNNETESDNPSQLSLRKIVLAVCSSPQRWKLWLQQAFNWLCSKSSGGATAAANALMLILNVCTHWSSTHQMLWRALNYRGAINLFVMINCNVQNYELENKDWDVIQLRPMLSAVHTIFRGLQQHLKDALKALSNDAAPKIKRGLTDAHCKLSNYYTCFNASPYYLWSAFLNLTISYVGLQFEFWDDSELTAFLESSKVALYSHFNVNYMSGLSSSASTSMSTPTTLLQSSASASTLFLGHGSPQKVNFHARFRPSGPTVVNKLNRYFTYP
ncbi:hypothetical protein CPB85DRAFT_1440832 [Mucidula mucida]|nr:hypothetical protein CPB85DRAFT_1440832 [Mucidula mucida]